MSKGLPRSRSRGAAVLQPIYKQTIRVVETVAVADGAPGFGTTVVAALPVGNLLFLGAVAYLQFRTDDADVIATFDGDYSLGTVATVDSDVADANEADLVPTTAFGAATAKVSPVIRGVSTDALGGLIIDNTAGDKNINLNMLIDDTSISGAASFTVSGTVHIACIVLGDD